MFLLDDILLAPINGLVAICRKVHDAAQEEMSKQEKDVVAALAELYQALDAGQINEEQFQVRETELLDRLDECKAAQVGDDRAGDDQEDDDDT